MTALGPPECVNSCIRSATAIWLGCPSYAYTCVCSIRIYASMFLNFPAPCIASCPSLDRSTYIDRVHTLSSQCMASSRLEIFQYLATNNPMSYAIVAATAASSFSTSSAVASVAGIQSSTTGFRKTSSEPASTSLYVSITAPPSTSMPTSTPANGQASSNEAVGSSPHLSTAAKIGIAFGLGALTIALLGLGIFLCIRWRRRQIAGAAGQGDVPEPITVEDKKSEQVARLEVSGIHELDSGPTSGLSSPTQGGFSSVSELEGNRLSELHE